MITKKWKVKDLCIGGLGKNNISKDMNIKSKLAIAITGFLANILSSKSINENLFEPVDMSSLIINTQEILKENININGIDKNTKHWIESIDTNGNWHDIKYTNYEKTNWSPQSHLNRMLDMTHAYTNKKSIYFNNNELGEKIVQGLSYWVQKAPYSTNWWFNDIAVPQSLGKILILLEGSNLIKEPLKNNAIRLMIRGNLKEMTGANKADIALHYLMRGMLTGNEILIKSTSESVFSEIKMTEEEGIQIDNSYHQHGHQLYISGYGDVFIESMLAIAQYLRGSQYSLQQNQIDILSSFVLDGFLPIFRGSYKDYNAGGRLIARKNALNYNGFIKQLKILEQLDKKNQKKYTKAIGQIQNSIYDSTYENNKCYWRSDYMIHNRRSYSASVRAASERINRMETGGNGENLKGTLISAGSTSVRVSGNEYFNIFPCWNWSQIPGVTSIKDQVPIIKGNEWSSPGSGEFIGGISNGNVGAFVLDYNEFSIQAHKGYFFFDNEIVCLGAGIKCNANGILNTTIEQNLLNTDINLLYNDNKIIKATNNQTLKNVIGILHNQIGYFINKDSNVELNIENRTGSWRDINQSSPDEKISNKVFTLTINHGSKPTNENYAYTIVPGIKSKEEFTAYPIYNIEIIKNNLNIQAVVNKSTKILQIIFYEKGTFNYKGLSISVDKPIIMLIPNYEKTQSIYVSDPTQKIENLKITINDKTINSNLTQYNNNIIL